MLAEFITDVCLGVRKPGHNKYVVLFLSMNTMNFQRERERKRERVKERERARKRERERECVCV